ncbi:MAG: protein kinase [Myxococcales bacterium]|nr:protein kinase [Myxococcales bacterium]
MKRGDYIGGRFEVQGLAGTGAMGIVWRALDRETGETVAVKLLRAGAEGERFLRESQLLAELDHPGIVKYVAHGTSDEGPYLVMEWLEGESLAQRLDRAELSAAESVRVATRIASAMGAAHRRVVVHRDLKPSNIFLVKGSLDDVRVLDFGIARQGLTSGDLTVTGVIVGSPRYMAPEQARGAHDVGPTADVWGIGAILFRCLTGRPLLADGPIELVLSELLMSPVPRVSDVRDGVPPELDELTALFLSKEPRARPPNGDAAASALSSLFVGEDVEPPRSRTARDGAVLTLAEQRFTCVLLISGVEDGTRAALDLAPIAARSGSVLERRGEHLALVFATQGTASDVVAHAARTALQIRSTAPGLTLALATGAGPTSDLKDPEKSVVARAQALSDAGASGIFVDQVSRGLLEARFHLELRDDSSGRAQVLGERPDPTPLRRLLGRATPCVGRERELAVLQSLLSETLADSVARVAIVSGDAGIGKSRIRYELLRQAPAVAREAGSSLPAIWLGRADPMAEGSPFGVLGSALRGGLGVSLGAHRRDVFRLLHSRAARARDSGQAERIAEALVDVVVGENEAARPNDPLRMGDQMRAGWEDFLEGELAEHPVILVLEDLHWGDWGSVRFVDAALRQHADRPLFVLALARPEIRERFPNLWAERRAISLPLSELGRRAAEQLVESMLGSGIDKARVQTVVERASGNAFFLEELIRAVAEGAEDDALPGSILAVAEARVAQLDPEQRQVLRAASVFGQLFWPAGVAQLLGRQPDSVTAELARLAERELVTRRRDSRFGGHEEYVFRHTFVRETAYSMLTAEDQRLGHRLAADWLLSVGEREPLLLAEHWQRGGEPAKAAPLYRRAAEHAIGGNDFERAVEHCERSLAAGATGELAGEVYLLMSQAHQWRGAAEAREAAARRAAELFEPLSPRWYVALGEQAKIASRSGRHAALKELFETIAADNSPLTAAARALVLAQLSVPALRAGENELAKRIFAALLASESHLSASDHAGRGWIARARGYAALVAGDASTYL